MNNLIKKRFSESIEVKKQLLLNDDIINTIQLISENIIRALKNGGKIIFAGNGGSFSDSFHLAGEFVSRFIFDRPALAAIALGGNNSIVTAVGNDYSYDDVFSRELYALGNSNDIFVAISTSGNSPNILKAIAVSNEKKIKVFGLTGSSGGKMKDLCNCICVPSKSTARIQESHIVIGHIICEIVEQNIFGK